MSFSRISAGGILFSVAVVGVGMASAVHAQQVNMTFFVTSAGKGNGADLGGLEGADAHCAALAKAAGAKATSWRAYLSTTLPGGDQGADARSRIGKGPWTNAKGVVVAKSVNDLHSEHNNLNKQTALTEKGEMVKGRGDTPNEHDILTGSDPDGRFSTAGGVGSSIVGHQDLQGLKDTRHMKSWNSSHGSRGCSQDQLKASGGTGLVYCFAAK